MLVCAGYCVCMCLCVYALRIVSTDKIFALFKYFFKTFLFLPDVDMVWRQLLLTRRVPEDVEVVLPVDGQQLHVGARDDRGVSLLAIHKGSALSINTITAFL